MSYAASLGTIIAEGPRCRPNLNPSRPKHEAGKSLRLKILPVGYCNPEIKTQFGAKLLIVKREGSTGTTSPQPQVFSKCILKMKRDPVRG